MTNEEIKADIIAACEKAKADGYKIIDNGYGFVRNEYRCACALTALAVVNNAPDILYPVVGGDPEFRVSAVRRFARDRYGWSHVQVAAFMNGFDLVEDRAEVLEYEIGQAVRAAVLP